MNTHPYAELFPALSDDEIGDMVADIKKHGLRHPIVVHEKMILDGRNRFRACQMAHVNPTFTPYKGDDALAFVLSENLHRRHLTPSQRAVVAANLANLSDGQKKSATSNDVPPVSQADAAKAMHVSVPSVQRAKKLLEEAPAKDVEAVKAGKKTVNEVLTKIESKKTKPPQQGRQKMDPRIFARMEDGLGAVLRRLDDLHRESPNKPHHDAAIRLVKDCMGEVKAWQKAARA